MSAAAARRAVWAWAIACVLGRGALTFVPGTWLWGLTSQRFLPAWLAWSTWIAMALAVLPPVSKRLASALERAGARSKFPAAISYAGATVIGASLVAFLPDRTWFLGDFILRQGTLGAGRFSILFPQAMPLDALLHGTFVSALAVGGIAVANALGRLLGTIEAAALAMLALAFAREVASGAARFPVAALMFFAGHLAVLTGFGKATGELVVLTAAAGLIGLRYARTGRHALAFGVLIALALLTHRSALALLPAAVTLWIGRWRAQPVTVGHDPRRKSHERHAQSASPLPRSGVLLSVAPVALTLLFCAPLLWRIGHTFDLRHHMPAGMGGTALSPFASPGVWLLDRLNALCVIAPLAPILPIVLALDGRRAWRDPAGRFLVVLASGWLPLLLIVQPQQGLFRDWDIFVAAGTAFAMLGAWMIAQLAREQGAAIAVVAAAIALVPTVQLLLVANDLPRGLARAEAFAIEPPIRDAILRSHTWAYIGSRNDHLGRWAESRRAYRNAAALTPYRRMFLSWGLAATHERDFADAAKAYRTLLTIDDGDPLAWLGVVGAETQRGDTAAAREATEGLRRAMTRPGAGTEVRDLLRHRPEVWPAGAEVVWRRDRGLPPSSGTATPSSRPDSLRAR